MSSTEFKADLKEILFMIQDVLEMDSIGKHPELEEFDEELYQDVIKEAAEFIEKEIAPLNKIADEQGARILKDGSVATPEGFKEAWDAWSAAGWMGICAPKEFGGQGLPETIGAAVREMLLGANPAFSLYPGLTTGAADLIYHFGSAEQKNTYCEKMYNGEWSGTMCLTEPDAGSYVGDVATGAEEDKEGVYKLKGSKIFITGGDQDLTENIIHMVLGRIKGSPAGVKGLSLFIVPKYRMVDDQLISNDVTTVSLEKKMGIKGASTAVLSFGDKSDCEAYLLGRPNEGIMQMFALMNHARLQVAFQGVGQASAAYQYALAYAKERIQGVALKDEKKPEANRVAIIEHPDVKDSLMYMKAMVEGMRGIAYSTAYYQDCVRYGNPDRKAYYQDLIDLQVPIAKAYCSDYGLEVASKGIQIFGGYGFTREYPVEQNYRDLRIAPIYEGTNAIQALDLVTRKLEMYDGRLLQTLMEQFQKVEMKAAQSIVLREIIDNWQEYVAGIILVADDIKALAKEKGPEHSVLNAGKILNLFGDVLACYYLILQGVAAESYLVDMGIELDKLEKAAVGNSEVKFIYNKLLTVEYFGRYILPRQEGIVRMIQQGLDPALRAIF